MILSGTTGFSAEVATGKISEIYEAVCTHQQQLTGFGFSRGFLGVSVFNYLYAVHTGEQKYFDEARLTFDKACDMIDSDSSKSYPQDFADLAAVSQYLYEAGVVDLEPNTFLSDVDTVMLRKMRFELGQKNIGGYVNGALGYGLYFLQRSRYNRENVQPAIDELIRGILYNARYTAEGCYWTSGNYPQNECTCLSFPHGSAAVILFLAKAVEMELCPARRLQEVVFDAISYIQSHGVRNEHYQYIDIVQEPGKSRLALSYGDMGIGYAMIRAGAALRNQSWYQEGITILKKCASRREESNTGVQDASILFGAAGLALMFDRISQITHEPAMKKAAEFWYHEILKYDCSPDGYAGIKAACNQWGPGANLAFSEGIIGVGCGLIKGLNPEKINFDDLIWLL